MAIQELITHIDDTHLKSYVALPDNSQGKNAGILIAPEWWGVAEHPKAVAQKLADLGFVAVVMDVYGEGKITADALIANEWMTQMLANQELLMARCQAILNDFATLEYVDGDRLGAIGYCFGGKIALDMARMGMNLKAVATFHGNPTPFKPAQKDTFKPAVLIAHGEADSMVSMQAIASLEEELDNADVDYTLHIYEGAKHGFSNPDADKRAADNGIDLAYDEIAATDSWNAMVEFMKKYL